ncbi:hypothetical protein CFE70_008842 [Pyrenophora teres f. teres 0-1]
MLDWGGRIIAGIGLAGVSILRRSVGWQDTADVETREPAQETPAEPYRHQGHLLLLLLLLIIILIITGRDEASLRYSYSRNSKLRKSSTCDLPPRCYQAAGTWAPGHQASPKHDFWYLSSVLASLYLNMATSTSKS